MFLWKRKYPGGNIPSDVITNSTLKTLTSLSIYFMHVVFVLFFNQRLINPEE